MLHTDSIIRAMTFIALLMEAVRISEMLVYFNDTTQHFIPEGCYLQVMISSTALSAIECTFNNISGVPNINIIRGRKERQISVKYVVCGLLGCDTMWSCMCLATFWRNPLPGDEDEGDKFLCSISSHLQHYNTSKLRRSQLTYSPENVTSLMLSRLHE
jgi:hypothetical protein